MSADARLRALRGVAHRYRTDRRLFESLVAEAVDGLPEPFRETIVLRDINDLSYREIAGVLGVPVGTVMSRLARARAMLRARWTLEQGSAP